MQYNAGLPPKNSIIYKNLKKITDERSNFSKLINKFNNYALE